MKDRGAILYMRASRVSHGNLCVLIDLHLSQGPTLYCEGLLFLYRSH